MVGKFLAFNDVSHPSSNFVGHGDIVNTLSYASDGSRFASGGADQLVVIRTNELQGLLKYAYEIRLLFLWNIVVFF